MHLCIPTLTLYVPIGDLETLEHNKQWIPCTIYKKYTAALIKIKKKPPPFPI